MGKLGPHLRETNGPTRVVRLGRRMPAARRPGDGVREEWTARPPGRLGRRLVSDIETYLEFIAIARDEELGWPGP